MNHDMTGEELKAWHSAESNEWIGIFRALNIKETAEFNLNPPGAPRWLCVCRGGNCRSAAVAFLLKYKYKQDALAVSLEKNDAATLEMLIKWANYVVVIEQAHATALTPFVELKKLRLLSLDYTHRLRAAPYDVPFLLEVDARLRELVVAALLEGPWPLNTQLELMWRWK